MPFQLDAGNQSGRISTTTGRRFARTATAVVIGTWTVFLLLPASATSALWLALLRATPGIAAVFVAGNAVSWRELDLQLNDFIPNLVSTVALGNRQQFAQTTTAIQTGIDWRGRRRLYRGFFNGIFGI